MRLQLSVWAVQLTNVSSVGTPDPFAVVTVLSKEPGVKPKLLGKTEVIENTTSPDWTKPFFIEDFALGKKTTVAVSIYDSQKKNNHPMGSALFEIGEVLGKDGNIAAKELKGGGVIVVHVEEATGAGVLHFHLRGLGLENTEGLGVLNKSDPFFELQRLRRSAQSGTRVWDCVYRSLPVNNNLSPVWGEGYIELDALCGGNVKQRLRLAVYDYDTEGTHDYMGEVKVSVEDMLNAVTNGALGNAGQFNLDKAFFLRKSGKDVGKIVVAVAEVSGADISRTTADEELYVATEEEEDVYLVASPTEELVVEPSDVASIQPTFVNFVSGGCRLHVIVAIDATATNGDPRKETSLHHFKNDGMNGYEEALFSLCSILSKYDTDQKYPVFGFGARRGAAVSHCFPLGSDTEVEGVDGILNAYSETFRSGITMSSPRDFSEVIRTAAKDAESELSKGQAYSILLLFTNGTPAESEKTVAALNAADGAPLSVVIVGVGGGDFSGMKKFEDRHKSRNVRDNVRFVHYDTLKSDRDKLREVALNHIPSQLEVYFKSKKIYPESSPEPAEISVQPCLEDIQVPIKITATGEAVVTGVQTRAKPKSNIDPRIKKVMDYGKKYMNSKQGKRQVGKIKRRIRTEGMKFVKNTLGVKF